MYNVKKASIGCVIMASGLSKRFGSENKLLVEFNKKALIENILEKVKKIEFSAIVCVTQTKEVIDIAKKYDVLCLLHSFPEKKDTVCLGLDYLLNNNDLDGIMFCVADQPLLKKESIATMCKTFAENKENIIRLSFVDNDKRTNGNPVIFPKKLYKELYALKDGENGRDVIKKHCNIVKCVEIDNILELFDVDTPESLENLRNFI